MSNKDKTREKLVESMRKTKKTIAAEPAEPAPTATGGTQADKPASKSVSLETRSNDNYQSGRRVWPD